MKRIFFILLMLLFCFPISAQNDALLLFTRYENDLMQVYLFNATRGEEQFLTTLENVQGNQWGDVGWSSDGRYVWAVDTVTEAEERRLRLFEMASGEEEVIAENAYFEGCVPSLTWSPDGEILSYFSNGVGQARDLNMLELETGNRAFWEDTSRYFYPFWSPNGEYLWLEPDILYTDDWSLVAEEIQAYNLIFSPNNRYIAYYERQDSSLHLYDLETGENRNLEIDKPASAWTADSRYLLIHKYDYETVYSYYDVQGQTFATIALDDKHHFMRFSLDSRFGYFRHDLPEDAGQELVRYEIATGESSVIFETTGWIEQMVQREDWLVIRYSPDPPEPYTPTNFVRIMNADFAMDTDLSMGWNYFSNAPQIAWSADGDWLMIHGDGKIYGFDPQTNSIEQLPVETDSYTEIPFWSPDGQYLAFETQNQLHIWDRESDNITILPEAINRITGWQGSTIQDSLLYCGSG